MTNLKNRLMKLEQRSSRASDGTVTLEVLCRALWNADKTQFRKRERQWPNLGFFRPQFEREDAERQGALRRRRPNVVHTE